MLCPRTGTPLTQVRVGGIEVDISEACGGVFFDQREIEAFKSKNEARGSALARHLQQFANDKLDLNQRIKCPKCTDVVMMRRYESPLHLIEIDECPQCAGIWLDTGELSLLQDNELSAREKSLLRLNLLQDSRHPEIYPYPSKVRGRTPKPGKLDTLYRMLEDIIPW